jgi:protoheme IX farnesyltransferase
MLLERKSDRLMVRTQNRPLASGLVSPCGVLIFATVLMCMSLIVFWFFVNPLSTIIGLLAILSYSFLYTPLKKYTPLSLFVGAFPGSAPLLLGAVCASGEIDFKAILFTSILFIWQMPHFIALSILYEEDYKKALIRVVSLVRGEHASLVQSSLWSFLLIVNFVVLFCFDYTSLYACIISVISSIIFFGYALYGFFSQNIKDWAFQHFKLSLYYLPFVMLILAVDSLVRSPSL